MSGTTQNQPLMLRGPRQVIERGGAGYPAPLELAPRPPATLYVIGNPEALVEGLGVVGARKATAYGRSCARRFAKLAAERGVCIVSGGARGCDGAAHEGALEAMGKTVVFLGGGCDCLYPAEHAGLFQRVVDAGGAVVSEHPWDCPPMPYMFRERNRLIAALSKAVLVVEAGLPSGTFSTADEALAAGKDVLAIPGAITAKTSQGSNRLIYQGATPIVDDEAFEDVLFSTFGCLRQEVILSAESEGAAVVRSSNPLVQALAVQPLSLDELFAVAQEHCPGAQAQSWLFQRIAEGELAGELARQEDGRYALAASISASVPTIVPRAK